MVSVVIPTYNRASIIVKTLESIKKQTLNDWECLVVDDGSSDNTQEVVEEYARKDARFHFLRNQHTKGAPGARNTGIENASGDSVILFDSDNRMHADCLEKMNACLEEGYDVCTCWSNVIDCDTEESVGAFKWICEGYIHDNLLEGKCYADNNSSLIKRSLLLEYPLDENVPAYQEWDTHIRISTKARYVTCREMLVDYLKGGADAISSNNNKAILGYLYILSRYKDEWINEHQKSFVKYSSFLLRLIRKEQKSKYQDSFDSLVPQSLKSKVYFNALIAEFKTTIGGILRRLRIRH